MGARSGPAERSSLPKSSSERAQKRVHKSREKVDMARSKHSVVVLMALAILRRCYCTAPAAAARPTGNQTRLPALFVFGDSIVDAGNNNAITALVRCNFLPYGQDFPGHNATGRFSNGQDFLLVKLEA
ncbi:hypothetical protein ABZP36_035036 [Zizania latifolia]